MNTIYEAMAPAGSRSGVATILEVQVSLDEPAAAVRIGTPAGEVGRAEAVIPRGATSASWAAKHYFREGDSPITVFEFDEPLPPGSVLLRIPFTPA
jgi:hypothetical protein